MSEHENQLSNPVGEFPKKVFYSLSDLPQGQEKRIGLPGKFPYTRGIHETMYRGRLPTTRMFAGYATAEETNKRFKFLLKEGQDGLSVAFDMLTLYGFDTDSKNPLAEGEFGSGGVACSSLLDMEALFKDIPLDQVSVSMTINSPAAPIWAMFLANAKTQGISFEKLRGTLQNDILKEYIAQKEYIFPPIPSMRLVVDTIEFASKYTPHFNPISISGYHIREKGATGVQELAFTLADGFAYVDACLKRGMEIDQIAPKLSFFFDIHNNFFEEIAKLRAARRIWAIEMREKYGAKDERSWKLRMHCQTAGHSLTAQQPENNDARTTLQALAAILGGTQSLHTNSRDEALALPTEEAVKTAVKIQQILKYESGVTDVVDPLGGSYYIEGLTNQVEEAARDYFKRIEKYGGVIHAIETGFFEREIVESAVKYQREVDSGERIIVGVNKFQEETFKIPPIFKVNKKGSLRQIKRLKDLRVNRDNDKVVRSLTRLALACNGTENVMPHLISASEAGVTLGEMMAVMREVFGEYKEPLII